MSSRSEITVALSLAIEKYINPHSDMRIYWAREVTFDNGTTAKCLPWKIFIQRTVIIFLEIITTMSCQRKCLRKSKTKFRIMLVYLYQMESIIGAAGII